MIKYQLICDLTHEFEGWFHTGAAFDAQNEAGLVTCPVCDSVKVRRALMTPNLASPKRRRDEMSRLPEAGTAHQLGAATPFYQAASGQTEFVQTASAHAATSKPDLSNASPSQAAFGEAITQLRQLQRKIKSECRDVGADFTTEVRKMHNGDSEPENIYGHSSAEERESLADEGIDVMTLPWLPPEH
jgi:hypothetical protein